MLHPEKWARAIQNLVYKKMRNSRMYITFLQPDTCCPHSLIPILLSSRSINAPSSVLLSDTSTPYPYYQHKHHHFHSYPQPYPPSP
mmetsp:Transcript_14738/g.20111  ORF Transcript_14738/g.20111 Transcript_14738/m.20111 type:complete len:86 (-) Transcript_14738:60-317(-)